jgi:hypothetical protein
MDEIKTLNTKKTPVLIGHLWQLKTVVILHWCLTCSVLLILNEDIYAIKFYYYERGFIRVKMFYKIDQGEKRKYFWRKTESIGLHDFHHSNTQLNGIRPNGALHDDSQHNHILKNVTRNNDTYPNIYFISIATFYSQNECSFVEGHYAECHYTKCCYADCRSAKIDSAKLLLLLLLFLF